MLFLILTLFFNFFQVTEMSQVTKELGFPIAVCIFLFAFCGITLYFVWRFMTEQIKSKDSQIEKQNTIITETLDRNTEATEALTQMLQKFI